MDENYGDRDHDNNINHHCGPHCHDEDDEDDHLTGCQGALLCHHGLLQRSDCCLNLELLL